MTHYLLVECRLAGRVWWYNARMSRSSEPLTEADILSDIVAPGEPTLNREFARAVFSVRFNDSATEKICELLQKNSAGTITAVRKRDLEKSTWAGPILDLMHPKARLSLSPHNTES